MGTPTYPSSFSFSLSSSCYGRTAHFGVESSCKWWRPLSSGHPECSRRYATHDFRFFDPGNVIWVLYRIALYHRLLLCVRPIGSCKHFEHDQSTFWNVKSVTLYWIINWDPSISWKNVNSTFLNLEIQIRIQWYLQPSEYFQMDLDGFHLTS